MSQQHRMSNSNTKPVSLRILDKEYVVACPETECETLLASASYLSKKLQTVREGGKTVSNERMVVVSALNVIHEYFQYKQEESDNLQAINSYVQRLNDKIDLALIRIKS